MTTGDIQREIIRIAEEGATRKEEARQEKIQQAILERIVALRRKKQQLEQDVRILQEKEARLRSQGKNFFALIIAWKRARKQRTLKEVERITP